MLVPDAKKYEFAERYLCDGDAIKAYKITFPSLAEQISETQIRSNARRLLKDPRLVEFLNDAAGDVKNLAMISLRNLMGRVAVMSSIRASDLSHDDRWEVKAPCDLTPEQRMLIKSFRHGKNGVPIVEFHDPFAILQRIADVFGRAQEQANYDSGAIRGLSELEELLKRQGTEDLIKLDVVSEPYQTESENS